MRSPGRVDVPEQYTTGAVYGQLAGAFYGAAAIRERWRSQLAHADLITRFADRLLELADAPGER